MTLTLYAYMVEQSAECNSKKQQCKKLCMVVSDERYGEGFFDGETCWLKQIEEMCTGRHPSKTWGLFCTIVIITITCQIVMQSKVYFFAQKKVG